MRDMSQNISTVVGLAPAVHTADANGVTVDRLGFDSVTFAVSMGAGGDTFNGSKRLDFIMEHSDDGTTWEPVGADNVIGAEADEAGVVLSQRTAHTTADVRTIGYVDGTIGDRRYVRLNLDVVGTHSAGTPLGVVAILGNPATKPVA